jgi:hypothetical protein
VQFGRVLGLLSGLTKVVGEPEKRVGAELVLQGRKLAEDAGKRASKDEVEVWMGRCREFIGRVTEGKITVE